MGPEDNPADDHQPTKEEWEQAMRNDTQNIEDVTDGADSHFTQEAWDRQTKNRRPLLIFLMGCTNVGKSTLLDKLRPLPHVGLVEVGKEMRRRYPPEHFKGQNNPAHTAAEAWQVMLDQITVGEAAGKKFIVIDGQPRDAKQAAASVAMTDYRKRYVFLHASHETRLGRAIERDGADLGMGAAIALREGMSYASGSGMGLLPFVLVSEKLKLSLDRMTSDYRNNLTTIAELGLLGVQVEYIRAEEYVEPAALGVVL